jgi:DNA polymerase III subunit delta'
MKENDFLPFSGILGQAKAIRFLKGVLSRERIPHGYLFLGMAGVGKTQTAMAMAHALNCLAPAQGEGCGRCIPCRGIQEGTFEDLSFLAPEGDSIGIDQIRGLERTLSFRPRVGKHRVTVLREAEKMTEQAANAFLKTLEEPPPGNVLVLQCSDLSRVLPTIVSRCQQLRFQPIPESVIAEWLGKEKGAGREKALLLARLSEGSIGRAARLFAEDAGSGRGESFALLTSLSGLPDGELLRLATNLKGKSKDQERPAVQEVLGLWKTWLRDLLLLQVGGREDLLIHTDFLGELKKAMDTFTIDSLMEALRLLDQAERDLSRFRNVELLLENLLLALKRLGRRRVTFERAQGVVS